MNRVVFGGLMQVSCTPIPPADTPWYEATMVPCTPYDPATRRSSSPRRAFPNPTVHLLTTNPTDYVRLAQFIQAQEAAVGINVVIDVADSATANSRTNSGNFEAWLNGLIPGQADPAPPLGASRASGRRTPAATRTRGST